VLRVFVARQGNQASFARLGFGGLKNSETTAQVTAFRQLAQNLALTPLRIQRRYKPEPRRAAGILIPLLGMAVMAGWWTQQKMLVQFWPAS
jgi:hypothetical protein